MKGRGAEACRASAKRGEGEEVRFGREEEEGVDAKRGRGAGGLGKRWGARALFGLRRAAGPPKSD